MRAPLTRASRKSWRKSKLNVFEIKLFFHPRFKLNDIERAALALEKASEFIIKLFGYIDINFEQLTQEEDENEYRAPKQYVCKLFKLSYYNCMFLGTKAEMYL